MKISPRLLTAALAAGAFTFAGVSLQSAFAQDGADAPAPAPAPAAAADDPMAGFTMPEPPPAHDYETGPDAEGFSSMEERVSYAIGVNIGTGLSREFAQMDAELDSAALASGIEKATAGEEAKLSEMQVGQTLQAFQMQMMEKQMAEAQRMAEENQQAAADFFAENKDAEGVQTTDSGLQYRLETKGEGATPTADDVVKLHYRGTLLDGTEFDSSYDRGQPAEFPVGGVIPGFSEALLLMPVGSKGTIWIPSDIAYGENPPPQSPIQPGSALSFDVEILDIVSEESAMGTGTGMEAGGADAEASGPGAEDVMSESAAGGSSTAEDGLEAPHRDPVSQ